MFSGPGIGAFFQPIRAAGIETAPTAAIQPLKKAGDEARQFDQDLADDAAEDAQQQGSDVGTPVETHAAETRPDDFGADVTHLSIAALRRMLLGDAAVLPDADESAPVDDVHQAAIAAYHRAEKTAIPAAPAAAQNVDATSQQAGAVQAEVPVDQKSPQYILHMLDVLQGRGYQKVSVPDGVSIYDALAALVRTT